MFAVVERRIVGQALSQASWSERRGGDRLSADLNAQLRARGSGVRTKAEVVDISTTGCRLLTWHYGVGDELLLAIGHLAPVPGHVRWVHNGAVGVEFASKLHPSVVDHLAQS